MSTLSGTPETKQLSNSTVTTQKKITYILNNSRVKTNSGNYTSLNTKSRVHRGYEPLQTITPNINLELRFLCVYRNRERRSMWSLVQVNITLIVNLINSRTLV